MNLWHSSRRTGLPELLLAILFTFTVSATPLRAADQRAMVNLRGDPVLVPTDIPPKERFVFQRLLNVDNRLVVFLYSDPRFRRPVDYSETYNLKGELLEIAWYMPTEGLKRARDINLGNPKARGLARILEIIRDFREDDQGPDNVIGNERLSLEKN